MKICSFCDYGNENLSTLFSNGFALNGCTTIVFKIEDSIKVYKDKALEIVSGYLFRDLRKLKSSIQLRKIVGLLAMQVWNMIYISEHVESQKKMVGQTLRIVWQH